MEPADPESIPEGWILVEEDIWVDLVDEPGEKFHKARENFLKKDYKAAATDIRKGAVSSTILNRIVGDHPFQQEKGEKTKQRERPEGRHPP